MDHGLGQGLLVSVGAECLDRTCKSLLGQVVGQDLSESGGSGSGTGPVMVRWVRVLDRYVRVRWTMVWNRICQYQVGQCWTGPVRVRGVRILDMTRQFLQATESVEMAAAPQYVTRASC